MIRTLLLAFAVSVAAVDDASAETRTILGVGVNSTCGQWQENRKAGNLASVQQRSWIAGFLSGHNVTSNDRDFLASTDTAAIYIWIDNYRRNRPLDSLTFALAALKTNCFRAHDEASTSFCFVIPSARANALACSCLLAGQDFRRAGGRYDVPIEESAFAPVREPDLEAAALRHGLVFDNADAAGHHGIIARNSQPGMA